MSPFAAYLQLGLEHITDINGYDHMVFLVCLVITRSIAEWRSLLVLVTAFTIGHSITLALAVTDMVFISSETVEFLIPVTILITSIHNLFSWNQKTQRTKYALTLFFGLIHGLGFSNYLSALLGQEESIAMPLLAFNVGLELGQLIIVGLIMMLSFVMVKALKVNKKDLVFVASGGTGGIALILMADKLPW